MRMPRSFLPITALLAAAASYAQTPSTSPTPAPATSTAPAPRPAMTITSGLAPFQVFQRDDKGRAMIGCAGKVEGGVGEIHARIIADGKPVEGLDWKQVGRAAGGEWIAMIPDIPTGGPYRVELQLKPMSGQNILLEIDGILVGDLWILAGQSNMQGVGDMTGIETPSPFVHAYEMNERWAIAEEPLHRLNESPDPVHHPGKTLEEIEQERTTARGPVSKGAGMGLPFAKELYNRTKVPIGLVPCAHGGTSMQQWDPAQRGAGGKSLYGAMYRRFQAVGGRVKGVLWYQGESDARPDAQKVYREKTTDFIKAVRRDFGRPDLPFYLVQISRVTIPRFDIPAWCGVREDERVIGLTVPRTATVSAIDLELDDIIHIGTHGLRRLGRRAAIVADHELFGNAKVSTGPRLGKVTPGPGQIRVSFEGVNGRLRPDRHIAGFSLRGADGAELIEFYDTIVDPSAPDTVICQFWGDLPRGANLWYGYGLNPYCNLVDEQDMGAPAFGPIQITPPQTQPATTPATSAGS